MNSVIILIFVSFGPLCLGQDIDQLLFLRLDSIYRIQNELLTSIKGIEERLDSLGQRLQALETNDQERMDLLQENVREGFASVNTNTEVVQGTLNDVASKLEEVSVEAGQCLKRSQLNEFEEASKKGLQDIHKEIEDLVTLGQTDECAQGTHNCTENEVCQDETFTFSCICRKGFSSSGTTCDDIDECIQQLHDCSENGICKNTPGAYTCQCVDGYGGPQCEEDVDECLADLHDCSDNRRCDNTVGSYRCVCDDGYWGPSCESPCPPEYKAFSGLGCLWRNETIDSFDNHRRNCESVGGRLLQHFNFADLQPTDDAFLSYGFVGVYDSKWLDNGEPIEHRLWASNHRPHPSKLCGYLNYRAVLHQGNCESARTYAYCQLI